VGEVSIEPKTREWDTGVVEDEEITLVTAAVVPREVTDVGDAGVVGAAVAAVEEEDGDVIVRDEAA